jgi:ABC-type uncharacterized transport system fused permease/ATPase subunit
VFSIGPLISASMLVAFVGILWLPSGPLDILLADYDAHVSGYLVRASLPSHALGRLWRCLSAAGWCASIATVQRPRRISASG